MRRLSRVLATLAAPLALAGLTAPAAAQADDTHVTDRDDHYGVDRVIPVEDSDPQMSAAIAAAQATLPEWLAILADPPKGAEYVVFKYPLGGWEHIWVDNVRRQGDILVGTLANHPVQEGHAYGERVLVPISEVSDWGWWDADGRAQGYRTMAVLFDRMEPAEAARYRRQMGWAY